MKQFQELARGLRYPEGPVVMSDGSIIVSEVNGGAITRINHGSAIVVAETGGSPAGCALGPDGRLYVCNSGGTLFRERGGLTEPCGTPSSYLGGWIACVDLEKGSVETLYDECDGKRLSSPNDIVFDANGGFYFTDLGKTIGGGRDRGKVHYAQADGSSIKTVIDPLETPNGIGLSPDGKSLYVAETIPGRLWRFDVQSPGSIRTLDERFARGELVAGLPGLQCFDSLAMQADGAICVATLVNGGITRITPGGTIRHFSFPDTYTTNLCFSLAHERPTAYITLSSTGRLVQCEWDSPGLPLNFQAPETKE